VVSLSCSLLFTAAYAAFRQNFHLSRLFRFPEPALIQTITKCATVMLGRTGGIELIAEHCGELGVRLQKGNLTNLV
jgi:hypothetical protein